MSAPTTNEIGTLSDGRYSLRRILGSGGMATVYEAWDTRLEVRRAIKILNPTAARVTQVTERFEREARTMAQLAHPHIALVLDVDRDGKKVFIVMELLEGGSLADLVKEQGPRTFGRSVEICDQVLQALALAHEQGVVHRDIKPHNVLLDAKGVCQVTDFGIAQISDQDANLTRTGAVLGTWMFMAPELRTDAKKASPRSDLYAVGTMLYILLTAREPFDLFASNLHDEHFEGIPAPLREVMTTATRFHPEERYETAKRMREALASALDALEDSSLGVAREPGVPAKPMAQPARSEETFPLDLHLEPATAATAQASVEPALQEPSAVPPPDVDPEADTDPRGPSAPTASFGTISQGSSEPPGAPRPSRRWVALAVATAALLLATCAVGYALVVHFLPAVFRGSGQDTTIEAGDDKGPSPRHPRPRTTHPDELALDVGPLTVTMADETFVTAAEVVCGSGFRVRSRFGEDRTCIVQGVPKTVDVCTLHFKGTAASYGPVLGGQSLTCTIKRGVAGCY